MAVPKFLVHREGDHVGVAVEDLHPGTVEGIYMDTERPLAVELAEEVPLGHKLALADIAAEAEVIEYGVRVGLARRDIARGQLVHVHNIRSARWRTA